jgi:hypothetical protein
LSFYNIDLFFLFAVLDFGLNGVIFMGRKKNIIFEACKNVIVFYRVTDEIAPRVPP